MNQFIAAAVGALLLMFLGKIALHVWAKRPANAQKLLADFVQMVADQVRDKCPFNEYFVEWTEAGNPRIVIRPPLQLVMVAPEINESVKLPYLERKTIFIDYDRASKLWSVSRGDNVILQSANPDNAVQHVTQMMNTTFKNANKLLMTVMQGHLMSRGMKVRPDSFEKIKPTFK